MGQPCVPNNPDTLQQTGRIAAIPFRKRRADCHSLSHTSAQAGMLQGMEQPFVSGDGADTPRRTQPAHEPGNVHGRGFGGGKIP